ncbi:N-6 DNA methylase [Candidatus Sumerlaeota bacterium]|nr:N-6 DNA methylase [Candidatus Sumerlaeota bacterium]
MTTSTDFIEAAYSDLGYLSVYGERLLDAAGSVGSIEDEIWTDKGDWLALAKEVNAERIFFLENNPVIVFARIESDNWEKIRRIYNRIWSMARPRLLFLAKPGELAVYDLAHVPPIEGSEPDSLKPLGFARCIAEVADKLARFRREEIESGNVFEVEKRFGDLKNRADKQLIHDLKAVRRKLISSGLGGKNLKYAHALIGRSIFIRYLEDRGVLTEKYFKKIVKGNSAWNKALDKSPSLPGYEMGARKPIYPRILKNHDFTFALFRQLAEDFNGDMFPDVENESKVVKSNHLQQIHDLMYGEVGSQKSLFFYAYDFKVVPVELISSIYEEFYHEQGEKAKEYGAFYTPPALAEFVVSQTLTPQRLATNPRVMDPACGSGIFLVESFRRIVRHRMAKQKRRLRFEELRKIVRDQLAGIDINPESISVAAFSLYLAMLNYLEPPDIFEQIAKGNRLPNLIVDENRKDSLNILLAANAFDMGRIETDPFLKSLFGSECADVVLGNPPWGSVRIQDKEAREQNKVAMQWCQKRNLPIGDQERSQTFIWRSLDMLKQDGVSGLLVSTGVFFKHHRNSVDFRRKWITSCSLDAVFNFSHCRHVFFEGVNSPFAFILFHQGNNNPNRLPIQYWSAKRTKTIEGMQSIVFSRNDLNQIPADMDLWNHWIWKVLWWGTHQDERLIRNLKTFTPLRDLTTNQNTGQGYKKANQKNEAAWLKEYKSLPIKHFSRYGILNLPSLLKEVPDRIETRGVREVYDGIRLLVQKGIDQRSKPKGTINARIDDRSFCFTDALFGIKLIGREIWEYKTVLGIVWSSLARYYFLLTVANWGNWHDEIKLKEELLSLPIQLPKQMQLRYDILHLVEELQTYDSRIIKEELFSFPEAIPKEELEKKRRELENKLDNAIFELYGLNEAEIDLIRDMCDIGIDFYYNKEKSNAVKPVTFVCPKPNIGNLKEVPQGHLGDYIRVFAQSWSAYMDPGTEMHWEVRISPKPSTMLAIIFTFHDEGDNPENPQDLQTEWDDILIKLDKTLGEKISSRIYLDGLARAVSDDSIIIIKRNELRFWTKSMAREDAEGSLVQSMQRNSMNSDVHL